MRWTKAEYDKYKRDWRVIRDGPCTYTFYADAQWNGLPLFAEEG